MSTRYLRTLMEERAGLSDSATALLDKISDENREPSPEERSRLDGWATRVKNLDVEIKDVEATVAANARFARTADRVSEFEEDTERREAARREQSDTPLENRSAGQQFVESEQLRRYNGRGTMEAVEFEDFLEVEQRAAITVASLGGARVRWDGPTGPSLNTPLLDVIGRERVSGGAVDYITWAPNPPTGAAVVAEGELKPEANLTPTVTPVSLDTIAYWKAITRQALDDFPRIRSIVDTKLRQGLAAKLEQTAAGVITAATFTSSGSDLAGIRAGIGAVQGAGYRANAVLLNPADFAQIDVELFTNSVAPYPSSGTYWGVTPVPVPSLPAGTAYVGDAREAVTWFDRGTAGVYASDSHADYFIRNLLVILAETRAAFAVTNPDAMREVTITAPVG